MSSADGDGSGNNRHWLLKSCLAALLATLALFKTTNAPHSYLCRTFSVLEGQVGEALCDTADRRVTYAQAASLVDGYFPAAAGAEPVDAMRFVAPTAAEKVLQAPSPFVEEWEPQLFAEAVGRLEKIRYNTWRVEVRRYKLIEKAAQYWRGDVENRKYELRMGFVDGDVRLLSLPVSASYALEEDIEFPRWPLARPVDLVRLPDVNSERSLLAANMASVEPLLTALCGLDVDGVPWVRTSQGWALRGWFAPTSLQALRSCDVRWRVGAAAL